LKSEIFSVSNFFLTQPLLERQYMSRYLCIHGHFYQPPRENAWLEKIEIQPSAHPFHDWNERITKECYYPNAFSRVLNNDGKIIDIVNNYSKISFNFGPTLLSWMEIHAPTTYAAILESDKLSRTNFGGHGSAVAQAYNHIIMPLANERDKETQILWGLEDFKSRFKRDAEGMWLGETAVDIPTLELLAKHNLKYTILAPRQAKRYRKIGTEEWIDGVNPNQHYWINLPSGKKIALYFYDGERSQNVAFKGVLDDGRKFANDLLEAYRNNAENELVHIATDGESYGHHHKNGDMALAFCLRYIEENNLTTLTNYGQYLELVEPEFEAEIHENSSWSCVHGVERWRSNCGCHTGGEGNWNQAWRAPLRDALDNARDTMIDVFETEMSKFTKDPWAMRDDYIHIVLDRSKSKIRKFLNKHVHVTLDDENRKKVMRLLEMQRNAMLMYTSCGWFFNDISGIETLQILQYAARAIQLGESESDYSFEEKFIEDLGLAKSNLTDQGSGKDIYLTNIRPYQLSLTQVGMHYAVASLFADDPQILTVFNYDCKSLWYERKSAGMQKLAFGTTEVNSKVTLSKKQFSFVVLYIGQHHLIGGTCDRLSKEEFEPIEKELSKAFEKSNISQVMVLIQEKFKAHNFSFFGMFKDEQMKLLNQYLAVSEDLAYDSYRKIYDRNYNILNVMQIEHLKIPEVLKQNINMVINIELKELFSNGHFTLEKLEELVDEVIKWNVTLDKDLLEARANERFESLFNEFIQDSSHIHSLNILHSAICLSEKLGLNPHWVNLQNHVFNYSKSLIANTNKLPLDGQQKTMQLLESICSEINIDLSTLKKEFQEVTT
jgi:alpha-amylase/alpha-mannosidase (GH57 family)